MYNITRQQAAEILKVSTRSVDRYIRAGKLRSKKDGKIIYIHKTDIDNLSSGWKPKQEVIVQAEKSVSIEEKSVSTTSNQTASLDRVYVDLREEIKKKDNTIQELALRLWRAEEIAKNSVTLIDFKKSQFLLEESKTFLNKEVEELKVEKASLAKKLKYEKTTNIIIMWFLFVLLIITTIIWFGNV